METAAEPAWSYELRALEGGQALERYTRWMLEPLWPFLRGKVIEVGAGIGSIAEMYLPFVSEAVLVEPAENLFRVLEQKVQRFRAARPVTGFLGDVVGTSVGTTTIEKNTFDTALMVNVLEHIPDDVGVLRDLYALLKPGGTLFVFVPAMPILYGPIDERVGHVRRYTRESLKDVVEAAGFEIDRNDYFDWLGSIPWFITGRILRQSMVSEGQVGLYDRFVIPVCRLVDELLEPQRFGKNLRLLARKPA